MSSNPKDPMSRFFEVDIAGGKRSNFNLSYKNRISADFGYLYPVGLWDVPSDSHFELDLFSALSSNPTLGPLLGKVKFRVEAYFIEKAAYVDSLRNNEKLPLDRDVPFPTVLPRSSDNEFSAVAGDPVSHSEGTPLHVCCSITAAFLGCADCADHTVTYFIPHQKQR